MDNTITDWWLNTRSRLQADLCKGFDSMVILVTWFLWKECNRQVFDAVARTPAGLLNAIVEEGNCWINAGNVDLLALLQLLGG